MSLALRDDHAPIYRKTALRGLVVAGVLVASVLAWPAWSDAKTIRAVMHSDLRTLDPILSSAYIARDHGYMVYDTLVAMDANFKIQPQMADWKVSDDKLTYVFTLRDGLKWHDGKPVTAEDCVASLKRWAAVDGMGQKLMDFTASLEPTDARTITLKLKEPYGLVLESLGKPSTLVPFIMPKRLADTPPGTAIPEQIGSGPFKFIQSEFQPGVKAVYEKNKDYVPRSEPPSWTSGGKVVKVDRVEWVTMPDAQTAANALQAGDIDFLERPSFDMLPILQADKDLTSRPLSGLGFQTIGRMNFLYPPFENVKVRRAAMMALNQKDVLDTMITGNPGQLYKICGAVFGCDTPLASDLGSDSLVKGNGMAEAKKLLAESGYDGTPVVMLAPTDVVTLKAQPIVAAQLLRQAGFQVTVQSMDWQPENIVFARPEAAKGRRLEYVLHQLGHRRHHESHRQRSLEQQGSQGRLGRLAGRFRDGDASRCLRAGQLAGGAEKNRDRDSDARARPGDLHSAGAVFCAERVAQGADGRSRWPGHAGVLEHR